MPKTKTKTKKQVQKEYLRMFLEKIREHRIPADGVLLLLQDNLLSENLVETFTHVITKTIKIHRNEKFLKMRRHAMERAHSFDDHSQGVDPDAILDQLV